MPPLTIDLPESKRERAPEEAFAWFLKAATQGHAIGMNMAGRYREDSLVVQQDDDAAFFACGEGARSADCSGQLSSASNVAARGPMQKALQ